MLLRDANISLPANAKSLVSVLGNTHPAIIQNVVKLAQLFGKHDVTMQLYPNRHNIEFFPKWTYVVKTNGTSSVSSQMENLVERLVVGSDARVKTGGMFYKCIDDAEYSTLATDFTCYNQAEM